MKLMATHFAGASPVEVGGNSPQQPMSGTPMVDIGTRPTGSSTYPLDIVAAFSGDREALPISIVNPTDEAQEFMVQISGVKLRGPGKLSQLAAPDVNASNEAGKEPILKFVEYPQEEFAQRVQVPPISINIYKFDVA